MTPAGKQSRSGNRATAVRWARILEELGHRVSIAESSDGRGADMMIAVHAWRSASSIHAFAAKHPERPLVVLLAGTDIYRFQQSHPAETLAAMDCASRLVCLHDLAYRAIPEKYGPILRVIHQSAPPLGIPRDVDDMHFDVCVIGHLRDEKDPLRAAYAARLAGPGSKLRVTNLGKAHTDAWKQEAEAEMERNPRFRWKGEVDADEVHRHFARSHAMVISSIMEGGANVVSEAVMAGLPVIASQIDGNVGLLGPDYGGYFPVKDTKALAALLQRAERDAEFLTLLSEQCRERQPLFEPAREREAWRNLLEELVPDQVKA